MIAQSEHSAAAVAPSAPVGFAAFLEGAAAAARARAPGPLSIAALPGEGIGPEVVGAALEVLRALEAATGRAFDVTIGGPIGKDAEAKGGPSLSDEVAELCRVTFARGGAVLAGPGGNRFVYDLRRRFDLYCKLSPLVPRDEILGAGCLRPEHVRGLDVLVVRENTGGVYQGSWSQGKDARGARVAEHTFMYSEPEVRRILLVAARIAASRRRRLDVVVKEGGVPTVSTLWREVAVDVAESHGLALTLVDIDLASFRLVHAPRAFDVICAPNLFGDVIGDLGGVLVGSRGITYSGNHGPRGEAVYQTNHGAAYDLAGTDRANPVGQIYSLAMLLRDTFGLAHEAALVEEAVAAVWRAGARTADLAEPGCRVVGTRELTALVVEAVGRLARVAEPPPRA